MQRLAQVSILTLIPEGCTPLVTLLFLGCVYSSCPFTFKAWHGALRDVPVDHLGRTQEMW